MSGWGVFLIILVVLLLLGGLGWVAYSHYRARRLGLPSPSLNPFARRTDPTAYRPPAPAPGGIVGWLNSKWTALRNTRTAGGAYESTTYASGSHSGRGDRRAFGPLDPDEAWDARVGNEAGYGYEEQELGLRDPGQGSYGGRGYGDDRVGVGGIPEERGRSRSRQRELDGRYEAEVHGGGRAENPFGDDAEVGGGSMRGVSPRPVVDTQGGQGHRKGDRSLGSRGSLEDSPTERRSMFREDV